MYIGIDLGSTNLKVALYDEDLQMLGQESCPVNYIRKDNQMEFDLVPYGEDLFGLMKKLLAIIKLIAVILGWATGILFIVYFWNLDQKLLGWAYVQVNRIFDKKKTDIKF